ncbi:hypothetical protein QYS48_29375 [Marivirga arenosa]|uniref:Uncharacterized protein n=1 Tax=Marivirga arenosa TaxID=3059076 RepID=A0AA51N7L1_9BACT|nr:hypothetical protein [Marivirga sp. ABR2-2]WMN07622.1 hypothetical protein QYS48_29375 [Marivirga sp. ABR2-2]
MHPVLIILIIFILLLIFGVFYSLNKKKKRGELFNQFAKNLGFNISFRDEGPNKEYTLSGNVNGSEVVYSEDRLNDFKIRDLGKGDWTLITFKNSPIDFDFEVYLDNWAMQAMKPLGYQDIEIGNAKFDKKFFCHSKEAEKLKLILDDQALQEFLIKLEDSFYQGFDFRSITKEKYLQFSFYGKIRNQKQLDLMKNVIDFMRIITEKFK